MPRETTHDTTIEGKSYDVLKLMEHIKKRRAKIVPIGDLPKPNRSRTTGFQKKRYEKTELKQHL